MKALAPTTILLLALFNIGCQKDNKDPEDIDFLSISRCSDLLISADDFSENIDVELYKLEGDNLEMTVKHSGGCKTIGYALITDASFMESNPVQVNLGIKLSDNDDCEALIEEKLCFSLTKIKELYQQSYQSAQGTIVINVAGSATSLNYSF
ncbi:hypothetical protein [Fulvivirga ligni]|uniref:hypothetical protein n=1 Tax=Fulvivirga ligni TaxID=2904246 RepID=UPI001F1B6748|nr:hypothetical protein [Fulvivirga ligni]UII19894.1 hypothetical protein LVD16_18790 [Fulvivirga ligni]